MLAGGMTIAAPSMMVPEVAAAGALYVSAENAMFNNTFGGAQIVEVVVLGISTSTDISAGEPTVKVNDNALRLAQGSDGNWYAYFGSETEVKAADAEGSAGLEYGTATASTAVSVQQGNFLGAASVFKPVTVVLDNADTPTNTVLNPPTLSNWNTTVNTHIVTNGQIGLANADWPIIQLYDLSIETFDVVLQQAGADEVVTLNYASGDMDDYAGMTLDRSQAGQSSDIHLVITDGQLNIDPTAEDVVSFYVGDSSAPSVSWMNRTLFTANTSAFWTGTTAGVINAANPATHSSWDNYFDSNGKLIINNATNGGDSILANIATADDATADNLMIFYEGVQTVAYSTIVMMVIILV